MNSEYQLVYKDDKGKPCTLNIFAESQDEAAARGVRYGLTVLGVNHVKDIIDWTQPTFSKEEAAAYCSESRTTFYTNVSLGLVNYVKQGENGRQRFRKVDLDAYLRRHLFANNKPALEAA